MIKKILLLTFFTAAILSSSLFAQEKDSTYSSDSTYTSSSSNEDDDSDCDSGWASDWGDWSNKWNNHRWHSFSFHGKPTLEATYGVSKIGIKSLGKSFANTGSAEIKVSYSSLHKRTDYISQYQNNFAFLSNNSMDLTSDKSNANDLTSETWRFGLGWQSGYAYQFGNAAIIPYNSNAFVWTRIKYTGNSNPVENPGLYNLSAVDAQMLKEFNETIRFGQLSEGGIKLQVVPILTLNAGYERAIVFPRHMFWKHAGSLILEGIGQGAIDTFVHEVLDSSPAAAPIVNFLLKNGFSYAFYQLRKEKMNWPFDTAEPLTYDTWKIGMTFTF